MKSVNCLPLFSAFPFLSVFARDDFSAICNVYGMYSNNNNNNTDDGFDREILSLRMIHVRNANAKLRARLNRYDRHLTTRTISETRSTLIYEE